VVEGNDHREAYTAIVRSGLLSRERYDIAEAEAVDVAEGNMSIAVMRGAAALPWSKTPVETGDAIPIPGAKPVLAICVNGNRVDLEQTLV
jgi:hypothetical protein